MDVTHPARFDCENTQDLANQTSWIALEVSTVVLLDLEEEIQLSLCHRLDDVLMVVTEDKEATTAASPLSCLEDLLPVVLWAE